MKKRTRKDPKGSLTQHAYLTIREKILKGEIPLGTSLPRHRLAKKFGMSVLPVAAALQLLESDGLVESLPRIGTRVRIPNAQQMRGHFIVREALESQAARLLAEKCSAEERLELQKMAAQLDVLYSGPPDGNCDADEHWFRTYRYHMAFHMRVAECTGCLELCRAIERNQVLVFNWLYSSSAKMHEVPERWHQSLVEKITSGDPEVAEAAMRRHIRYGMDVIIERLQNPTTVADRVPVVY